MIDTIQEVHNFKIKELMFYSTQVVEHTIKEKLYNVDTLESITYKLG